MEENADQEVIAVVLKLFPPEGIRDSLQLSQLIVLVRARFAVRFEPEDLLDKKNFEDAASFARCVARRLEKR